MNTFRLFFRLGLHHIWAWDATDHQLFLLALTMVFAMHEWKKLLALVTVFTVTHTLSLMLMVYDVLRIPENWVEQAIVWTIILTALSNVLIGNRKLLHRSHLWFAFLFGLVHGLGFGRAFMMVSTGYEHKLLPLLYFAGGIETAQAVIVIGILLVLWLWRKLFGTAEKEQVKILSYLVIGYSLSLLIERM